jgi:membrane-associated phospholipid phosphatase
MPLSIHTVANIISWVINPVFVAPAAYAAIVLLGYGNTADAFPLFVVLFAASTLVPILLIVGLKRIGKISDYNITFREQRFLPLLVLVAVNLVGYEVLKQMHPPRLLTGILLFNAVNTVFILLITLQWKISIHLFSYASAVGLLFVQFGNVALWLLLVVPLLMWSRIYLKAHTFMQTLAGTIAGFATIIIELKWWTAL